MASLSGSHLPGERAGNLIHFPTEDGGTARGLLCRTAAAIAGVVLCHPHPQMGGRASNHVVQAAAQALQRCRFTTLCVAFRRDAATGDHRTLFRQNVADCRGAIAHLQGTAPEAMPTLLWGYSWGAAVATAVATSGPTRNIASLVLVSPPLGSNRLGEDSPWPALRTYPNPVLMMVGDRDELCPARARRELGWRPAQLWERPVAGVDHHWAGEAAIDAAAEAAAWAVSHGGIARLAHGNTVQAIHHEEVGSESTVGVASPIMAAVVGLISNAHVSIDQRPVSGQAAAAAGEKVAGRAGRGCGSAGTGAAGRSSNGAIGDAEGSAWRELNVEDGVLKEEEGGLEKEDDRFLLTSMI